MSDEILRALAHLLAIITKQDGGVSEKEHRFVINFFRQQLTSQQAEEYILLYEELARNTRKVRVNIAENHANETTIVATSASDSVKTLAICRKINQTLTQKQKIVVTTRLLELLAFDGNITPQSKHIIETVAEVFNIPRSVFRDLERFVFGLLQEIEEPENFMLFHSILPDKIPQIHFKAEPGMKGRLLIYRAKNEELYLLKYDGQEEITLNGLNINEKQVHVFSTGSKLKLPNAATIFFSDVVSSFHHKAQNQKISFVADSISYTYPNGNVALQSLSISEGSGKLVSIMGGSGTGKSTLVNILAGLVSPTEGSIRINGQDLFQNPEKARGFIGYVSQEDVLSEDLTVFENLYFSSRLCFGNLKRKEVFRKVRRLLIKLKLWEIKDLKVGNFFNKQISGGQRKRLHIAMELIREPSILILDEPTSGLSSKDTENVIELLKELSLSGKLIFTVIHQPSSDIYKMFDKIIILDKGGYVSYYGNPSEAITYFKSATNHLDAQFGECFNCGNVNPEQIFNILEAQIIDEYGQFTGRRKITPEEWNNLYLAKNIQEKRLEEINSADFIFKRASILLQTVIYFFREVKTKLSNTQYLLINLFEAPILAILLAFIIRYNNTPGTGLYSYRYNDNIPAYLLIAIIISLFMGLMVSGEEIIKDKKIRFREKYLGLSWGSYLFSKIVIIFIISAFQTFAFSLIGNQILEIKGLNFDFWLMLFSVSCFANALGLNISSALNTPVAVYIAIPLLLIPQMILSGGIFNFDKLNTALKSDSKVPFLADFMASRWAFEGLVVNQFKNNPYQSHLFWIEQNESEALYVKNYLYPLLRQNIDFLNISKGNSDSEIVVKRQNAFNLVKNTFNNPVFSKVKSIDHQMDIEKNLVHFENDLEMIKQIYHKRLLLTGKIKDETLKAMEAKTGATNLSSFKNKYFNESLSDLVRNSNSRTKISIEKNSVMQLYDPIYAEIEKNRINNISPGLFSNSKLVFGVEMDTFKANLLIIWFQTFILLSILYLSGMNSIRIYSKKVNIFIFS